MVSENAEEGSRVSERKKQRKNEELKIGMVSCNSFKRGDIAWARPFPQTWWPGLVLRRDRLGFLVSFFDCERPQYFMESEIRSFIENFKSLSRKVGCSSNSMLLDRALILLGRRTAFNLMCPCQISMEDLKQRNLRVFEATNSFQPVVFLRFVVNMAVCPFFEDADIVNAVRETARLKTFRRYFSIQQRLIYRREAILPCKRSTIDSPKPTMTSIYSKLQSYSSFAMEMHSVTQESNSLEVEVEDKCQVFSELVEKNLEVSVTNNMNSRSLVSNEIFEYLQEAQRDIVRELSTSMEESLKSVGGDQVILGSDFNKQDRDELQYSVASSFKSEKRSRARKSSTKQSKAQSLHENHEMLVNLHRLALDPFYLGGESLKTMEQNFLNFRILSYQNIADLPPKKCSPCKTIVARFSHSGYDYSFKTRLSDKVDGKGGGGETFGCLIPSKQSPVNHVELKRRLDQPVASNHLKLCKTMPFFSITGAHLQRNRTICDADLSDAFFSGSLVQNLAFTSPNSLMCLDVVQNNVSLVKGTSHCSEIVEIGMV